MRLREREIRQTYRKPVKARRPKPYAPPPVAKDLDQQVAAFQARTAGVRMWAQSTANLIEAPEHVG